MSAVASLWLRHASHYLTLATPRPPNYNIIPFYSVTTFQSKKQKMFRYPHIIYILIHISILFVSRTTLYGTKLHEVSISCNSGHVCESKQLHNTLRAVAGRARASACVAPQRKGRYRDKHTLSKRRIRRHYTIEQNTRFAKIRVSGI